MKILLSTLAAVALAAQPFMLQAAGAPTAQAPAKVAGTSAAMGSGVDMETVELSLLIGGLVVAVVAGASSGGHDKNKDCHCHGGGGTTGTTGTTN